MRAALLLIALAGCGSVGDTAEIDAGAGPDAYYDPATSGVFGRWDFDRPTDECGAGGVVRYCMAYDGGQATAMVLNYVVHSTAIEAFGGTNGATATIRLSADPLGEERQTLAIFMNPGGGRVSGEWTDPSGCVETFEQVDARFVAAAEPVLGCQLLE